MLHRFVQISAVDVSPKVCPTPSPFSAAVQQANVAKLKAMSPSGFAFSHKTFAAVPTHHFSEL